MSLAQPQVLFPEGVMMEVLNVVAILAAGLMVGCELAIAAFIHPTLDKLPDMLISQPQARSPVCWGQ